MALYYVVIISLAKGTFWDSESADTISFQFLGQ
jgi:hypothetical protein